MKTNLRFPEPLKLLAVQANNKLEEAFSANDHLKWLIVISGFILYLGFVLFLVDQSRTARDDFELSQTRFSQIIAQVKETRWPQRAAEAEALIVSLEQKFWPGETPGLVEAGFERWIRQTLEQHGIEVRQVQLTRGPAFEGNVGFGTDTLPSLRRVRAKVIAPLNEAGLIRFLDDAASNQSSVIIEKLIVRAGRNARIEMDLATVFKSMEPPQ
jgi:hypothetical protein